MKTLPYGFLWLPSICMHCSWTCPGLLRRLSLDMSLLGVICFRKFLPENKLIHEHIWCIQQYTEGTQKITVYHHRWVTKSYVYEVDYSNNIAQDTHKLGHVITTILWYVFFAFFFLKCLISVPLVGNWIRQDGFVERRKEDLRKENLRFLVNENEKGMFSHITYEQFDLRLQFQYPLVQHLQRISWDGSKENW